jgi:NADPH2:quinone reductase
MLTRYTLLLLLTFVAICYCPQKPITMQKQTALIVSEVGGRVKLTSDWPVPQLRLKQIQIRVTVAGLNPHDQKARDAGLFIKDALPAVLGNDVTGIVTLIGTDVTKFKIGDRVASQS